MHQRANGNTEALSSVSLSELKAGELFHLLGQEGGYDDLDNYVPEWRVVRVGRIFYEVELKARGGGKAAASRPIRLSAATKVYPLPG